MVFSSKEKPFVATTLYIKQHNVTGLKYFGKTVQDVDKYNGSGIYWTRHLAIHGYDVTTLWSKTFYDKNELIEYALNFSKDNNIVEAVDENGNKIWANLKIEDGLAGGHPGQIGIEKLKETVNDPYYKTNILPKTKEKEIKTKTSEEWKAKTYKLCNHCQRSISPGNYNRLHGDKCKLNPTRKIQLFYCEWCKKSDILKSDFKTWHGDNCDKNPINIKNKTCIYCGTICQTKNHLDRTHGENCSKNPKKVKDMFCHFCGIQCNRMTDFKKWHGDHCSLNPTSSRYRPKK